MARCIVAVRSLQCFVAVVSSDRGFHEGFGEERCGWRQSHTASRCSTPTLSYLLDNIMSSITSLNLIENASLFRYDVAEGRVYPDIQLQATEL